MITIGCVCPKFLPYQISSDAQVRLPSAGFACACFLRTILHRWKGVPQHDLSTYIALPLPARVFAH
jgi:hypothetical protein